MTDIHAYPYETGISHRADRRCPCGVKPMKDMNEPSRTIFIHRNPPSPRAVVPERRACNRWAGPEKGNKP